MVVLDTSIVIDRVKRKDEIKENITGITFVEYPAIIRYKKFHGNVLFPTFEDFLLAHKIQERLLKIGKPKAFADLLIASICISNNEELITKDKDFLDIARVSNLRVKVIDV
ncbi:PIN domain-containing protein [Pyrococcus abyssi]|uniref:Nucleic acid-binding protein n=1 Tax=Pyrococcus abyssi (strain GE5 / Orsay) TaxID=272844 RepID=Q9UZF4_PYRAB|nr:type II toxin-antitoxin system VapC family toxin [Pyrococcus abyssi]CAB50105.1 Predicted nucleic acid-binding protein, contains PIN domain [Pyrococcus abyssi GE5]CCE70625.1 TPA: nucleic acid-binding protein [Pyrococcus abyssi GE5]